MNKQEEEQEEDKDTELHMDGWMSVWSCSLVCKKRMTGNELYVQKQTGNIHQLGLRKVHRIYACSA